MIDLYTELEKLEKQEGELKSHQIKVMLCQGASVITGIISLGQSDISLGAAYIAFILTEFANKGVPQELEKVRKRIARILLEIEREKENAGKQ